MTGILIMGAIAVFILLFAVISPFFFQSSDKDNALHSENATEAEIGLLLDELEKTEEDFEQGKIEEKDYRLITNSLKKQLIELKEKPSAV